MIALQAQQLYGQSFMCMSMAASELEKIAHMAAVSSLLHLWHHITRLKVAFAQDCVHGNSFCWMSCGQRLCCPGIITQCLHNAYTALTQRLHSAYTALTQCLHSAYTLLLHCLHSAYTDTLALCIQTSTLTLRCTDCSGVWTTASSLMHHCIISHAPPHLCT